MNKKDMKSVLLFFLGVVCIGISFCGLYGVYKDYKKAKDIYDDAQEEYVTIHAPVDTTAGKNNTEENLSKGPWYEMITVDITGLQKRYPDVVGWIFFEDGLISYPVMQAEDNETYLHTTYNGRPSKSGSIFMGANDSDDFSDTHTLIYGHNMKNLSMFGRLKHYKTKPGYDKEHAYFQIVRENEILRYQIFSYQDVAIDSFVYQENNLSAKELSNLLLKGSKVNPELNIEEDDKIITLSTCTADDNHRFVVSAVLIDKYTTKKETNNETRR